MTPHLFRQRTWQLLSFEDSLLGHPRRLPPEESSEVTAYLDALLPPVGVLVPLPGAEAVAEQLGQWRGLPVVRAAGMEALVGAAHTGLVSLQLTGGVPELDVTLHAAHAGLTVRAAAALIERTSAGGRSRLELQGMSVLSVLELTDTPDGLVFERRDAGPRSLN